MSLAVSVVIPQRGAEAVPAPVLEKCRPHADEILVVAQGDALRRGLERVRGDIVVFLEADGSHDPGDIPKLIAPLVAGQADHSIASRQRGGSDAHFSTVPQLVRKFGEQMFTLAVNRRFGLRLTDAQNGFRALLASSLRRLSLRADGAILHQELTLQSIRHGLRMIEVPIHGYASVGPAAIPLWRSAPRTLLTTLRHLVRP